MPGVARQKIGSQGRRPTEGDRTHCGMACRLSLMLSLSIGIQITRDGTSELQFSCVDEGI